MDPHGPISFFRHYTHIRLKPESLVNVQCRNIRFSHDAASVVKNVGTPSLGLASLDSLFSTIADLFGSFEVVWHEDLGLFKFIFKNGIKRGRAIVDVEEFLGANEHVEWVGILLVKP